MSEHDEQGVPLQWEPLGDFHLVWNLDTAKLHWRLISEQLPGSGDEMRLQLLTLDTPAKVTAMLTTTLMIRTILYVHMYISIHVREMRRKEGRSKQGQTTTRQSNTAHPRQSLFQRKVTCEIYN